jgi:MFS transporter, DHA2 family, multidrug resistance protein
MPAAWPRLRDRHGVLHFRQRQPGAHRPHRQPGVSADEARGILTTYSSTLFLGVPASIWLAGHVGHKRFLIASILLFAVASMGYALSPALGMMLVFRAIQGAAGAGLVV